MLCESPDVTDADFFVVDDGGVIKAAAVLGEYDVDTRMLYVGCVFIVFMAIVLIFCFII